MTNTQEPRMIVKLFFIAEGKFLPIFAQILICHELSQPKPHYEGYGEVN